MSEYPTYRPRVREDFDRLYRDSYRRILFTVTAVLRDAGAAEECTQEVFVRAYRAWGRWKPDAPAEAWLHRIAVNVAVSYRRRQRLRWVALPLSRSEPASSNGYHADATGELIWALRRLPAKSAALIVLRHHHGYTNREIAAALGVPESTVSSRLAVATRQLRAELDWDTDR